MLAQDAFIVSNDSAFLSAISGRTIRSLDIEDGPDRSTQLEGRLRRISEDLSGKRKVYAALIDDGRLTPAGPDFLGFRVVASVPSFVLLDLNKTPEPP